MVRVTRSCGKRKKHSKEDEDEKKVSEYRFIYKAVISDLRDCEKKRIVRRRRGIRCSSIIWRS